MSTNTLLTVGSYAFARSVGPAWHCYGRIVSIYSDTRSRIIFYVIRFGDGFASTFPANRVNG
jgi:hypothetical protein